MGFCFSKNESPHIEDDININIIPPSTPQSQTKNNPHLIDTQNLPQVSREEGLNPLNKSKSNKTEFPINTPVKLPDTPISNNRTSSPVRFSDMAARIKNRLFSVMDPPLLPQSPPSLITFSPDSDLYLCLNTCTDWHEFDIFKLNDISQSNPLYYIGQHLFNISGLISEYKIDQNKLANFIFHVQHFYNDIPYHNQIHASDVLISMYWFITTNTMSQIFNSFDVLLSLIAAIGHDLDHPGFKNDFLAHTENDLVMIYNDKSVLEHHHLACCFLLLKDPSCCFLENLSIEQRKNLRDTIIKMVIATDMFYHLPLQNEFSEVIKKYFPMGRVLGDLSIPAYTEYEKELILKMMLHISDLSQQAKPPPSCTEWALRVAEEFFIQGDLEKELGHSVSAGCDRKTGHPLKSCIAFISFICKPLFRLWYQVLPESNILLDQLDYNVEYYDSLVKSDEKNVTTKHDKELLSDIFGDKVFSKRPGLHHTLSEIQREKLVSITEESLNIRQRERELRLKKLNSKEIQIKAL